MDIDYFGDRVIGETGLIKNLTDDNKTIYFKHKYENPVVFTQPLSDKEIEAATVRINHVQGDRFTAFVQKPSNLNSAHKKENVAYLVLEQGDWQLDNNSILEVDSVKTDLLGNEGWEKISFENNFSQDPLVFSQIQTNKNGDFTLSRQKKKSSRGFEVSMQKEEALMNKNQKSETIGWMAISSGKGNWNQNKYQAGKVNNITDRWSTINFNDNFSRTPALFTSISTYNGYDTSALLSSSLSKNEVDIKIQEDTTKDSETYHSSERVDFLAIDRHSTLRGSQANRQFNYVDNGKKVINFSSYHSNLYTVGSYYSTVWTQNIFEGNFQRQISGNGKSLNVKLDARSGGFDTGIIRVNPHTRADGIDPKTKLSAKIDVNLHGSGSWWVGPKVSVKENLSQNLHGNYENYVVENASRNPAQYHGMLTQIGTYLGQTYHDGSIYKHYRNKHKTWEQFWAVRQNYRTQGFVSLKPVLNMWRKNGLPNEYVDPLRMNLETHGKVRGTVKMSRVSLFNPTPVHSPTGYH